MPATKHIIRTTLVTVALFWVDEEMAVAARKINGKIVDIRSREALIAA